jgi:hypothetical protein
MANVAAGTYVFSAKTVIAQQEDKDSSGTVVCTLDAGGTTDVAELRLGKKHFGLGRGTVHMQLTKSFASTGTLVLRCESDADFNLVARHTTIVAIKVGAVARTAVNG